MNISYGFVQTNKTNTNIYCQTFDEEVIFVNTHQPVVKEAELRLFSTWPCPCLACLPLTGRKLLYITDGSNSSLQPSILRLKSSCNLWNRLYFYWFTAQNSITFICESQDLSRKKCAFLVYLDFRVPAAWLQAKVWTERSFKVPEPHLCSPSKPLLHCLGVFPPMC